MALTATTPVYEAISAVLKLYSQYITDRGTYNPFAKLVDLFEGENGVITVLDRLTDVEVYQAQTLGAFVKATGALILLANGYGIEPLTRIYTMYLDLLVACKADAPTSQIVTSQLNTLYSYLVHLLGGPIDPNLKLEVEATARAIQLQLNLPYRQSLNAAPI